MSTFEKMWSLLTRRERNSAFVLLFLMIVGMGLEMLGIGLVIPAISLMTQSDVGARYPQLRPALEFLGNPDQAQLIVGGMIGLVVVSVVKASFLAFFAWRQARFSFGLQVQLSQRLFAVYLRQPYTFHLQRNSAELMRNAFSAVDIVVHVCIVSTLQLLTEILVLFGIFALLLMVEPFGAVVVVSVLGSAGVLFHRITRGRIARWGVARQHHEALRVQHLQQGLGGAKEIKLLGRENEFLDQYQLHSRQDARVAEYQSTLQALPRLMLELLGVVGLATLVLIMITHGREPASIVPTLALFAAAAFRLMPSVNRVLLAVQSLRYRLPYVDTLHGDLSIGTADDVPRASAWLPFRHQICLEEVAFSYPGTTLLALDRISITIRKGESVGFMGSSGAGKSTLADVILGLLTPSSGVVTVDGRNIEQDLRAWQNQIGYVPQAIYLTDDSLRRNVAFGLPDGKIDDAAVRRAIKAAQLEGFIRDLPDGLNTIVGERGVKLSGGQRQRIGIARALYHDPDVLMLDEATSALDTNTERDVMNDVMALKSDKTILIIAHRLTTVQRCDRLYRLEKGRIVQEGSPAEMLPTQDVQ